MEQSAHNQNKGFPLFSKPSEIPFQICLKSHHIKDLFKQRGMLSLGNPMVILNGCIWQQIFHIDLACIKCTPKTWRITSVRNVMLYMLWIVFGTNTETQFKIYDGHGLNTDFSKITQWCFQFTHSPCDDWENIYILCLIIIIKSEVWTITHCLGLVHETMVWAVCLSIFLWCHLNWAFHQNATLTFTHTHRQTHTCIVQYHNCMYTWFALLLCFVSLGYWTILPIYFRDTSPLGQ